MHLGSRDSRAAQVPFSKVHLPLQRPQTAQNCGAHSARTQIQTEMYWFRQYLSIDIEKLAIPILKPTNVNTTK